MGKKKYASRQRPQVRVQPQQKANPSYAGIVHFTDLPSPVSMPKNYKAFAQQGFAADDTLYKCIQYIMTNGAAIAPKLYTDVTMSKEITKHPLLDKLAQPNPEQSGVDYREAVLGYFLIAANSYQYAIRANPNGPPDELWTLEPNKVSVVPDPVRGITGYKFDEFEQQIPPQNIGRMRSWNPNNALYGMSPIEVGAILIDMQTAAKKWNLALLQNYARMPGAWVAPVTMGKNERDQLEAKLNGKFHGYANAGKAPVLDGGLQWQSSAIPPAEMDWLQALQHNSNAIANLYNIPPQIIGDTSATTYNNMQEAKAASYTEAIFPLLDKLYALWNMWLLPMYSDLKGAYLYYDKDSVEVVASVIQARKDAEADRAVKAYMAGACTLNQSLIAQGLPSRGPAGEVYRLGAVLVPADKLMEYAEQSLTTPAAPPTALPEPIQVPPGPGTPPASGTTPEPKPADDTLPPKEPEPEPQPVPKPATPKARGKRKSWRQYKAASTDEATHILWECDPDACDWCLQNAGCIVAIGDAFPNGATSPDDSHRFCKCTARYLSLPDGIDVSDIDPDALADGDTQTLDQSQDFVGDGDATTFSMPLPFDDAPDVTLNGDPQTVAKQGSDTDADWYWQRGSPDLVQGDGAVLTSDDSLQVRGAGQLNRDLLIAAFGLAIIASRHARDVAARDAAQASADDEDERDDGNVDYGSPAPKKPAHRKERRAAYQAFMEATLQ